MYAQLDATYTTLATRLNIIDKMNELLTEPHSWSDDVNNPLITLCSDPSTLDTPEKRRELYDLYLQNYSNRGLYRTVTCSRTIQLHPNIILAKVEHIIRDTQAADNIVNMHIGNLLTTPSST